MRVARLFFLITPMTCVSSIFLFAFGVSALSYFLTGQENVDIWTVLKIMEGLPDPREFLTGSLKIFNVFSNFASDIKYFKISQVSGNPVLNALIMVANGMISLVRAFITIIGFIMALAVSIITFPIYCVFFTVRSCAGFLSILNVEMPYNLANMSWDSLFDISTWVSIFN